MEPGPLAQRAVRNRTVQSGLRVTLGWIAGRASKSTGTARNRPNAIRPGVRWSTTSSETPIKADEKPEAVEVGVEADLSRHGLPTLVGIIDLVRAGGRIVDFKVVGKTPGPEQVVHVHEVQLTSYSLLYRDATGRKESGLELHHLVKTKAPKLVVSLLPPATEQQQTRLFRQIESYQAGPGAEGFRSLARVPLCRVRILQCLPLMVRRKGGPWINGATIA